MSKIDSSELVDIFKEEINKKEKKELKKKKKIEKKIEKQEDIDFEKIAKEEFQKQIEAKRKREENEKNTSRKKEETKKIEEKRNVSVENGTSVSHFLYDTMFGFFLILLFLCTVGYCFFLLYTNFDKNNLCRCTLLLLFTLSYLFSLTCKKENNKKIAALLSCISISLLMVFLIYIA